MEQIEENVKKKPYEYMIRFLPYNKGDRELKLCLQVREVYPASSTAKEERDLLISELNKRFHGVRVNKFPCIFLYQFKKPQALMNFADVVKRLAISEYMYNTHICDVLGGFPSVEYANANLQYVLRAEITILEILGWFGYMSEYMGELPLESKQQFCPNHSTNQDYLKEILDLRSQKIQEELSELEELVGSISDVVQVNSVTSVLDNMESADKSSNNINFMDAWI